MKTSILVAVAVATVLSAQAAYADDARPADKKGAPARDAKAPMGAGMPMAPMQANMMKLHDLMHRIHDAKDPQEREKLMQEHMRLMQEHMKTMQGAMGGCMGGMMGGDAKGGTMGR